MTAFTNYLPFVSSIIVLAFAVLIFRRYAWRHGTHLLVWGMGFIMYDIGSLCESYYTAFGWNPLVLKIWYLFGAILVAAWLGQGTVYLLASRRWAHITMAVLSVASVYAAIRIAGAQLDPQRLTTGELSGRAITSMGVRILTPFFNTYGTFTLAGGAAYSAWVFWRKHILPNRMIGNVLILVGALAPALGGLLSRVGLHGYLYVGELLGAILMFIGFVRCTEGRQKPGAPA